MTINRKDENDISIFSFEDEEQLLEPDYLRESIHSAIAEGQLKILIDFENIQYISSSALGCLVTAYRELQQHEGVLKLVNVQPNITKLMGITRLDRVIEMFNDMRTATASFG